MKIIVCKHESGKMTSPEMYGKLPNRALCCEAAGSFSETLSSHSSVMLPFCNSWHAWLPNIWRNRKMGV